MHELPKTKIIATIGPSTWEDETLVAMINSGLCIARINASFADAKELERVSTQLRKLSPRVAVMLDTMGHKVRVTGFEDDIKIEKGDLINLVSEGVKVRGQQVIQVTYPTLEKDIVRGVKVLLDDGNIVLQVRDIKGKLVVCEAENSGTLKRRKTVNIPGVHLNFPKLSDKDEEDIKFAVKNNFDLISASFIRDVDDVAMVRKCMGESDCKLIAKIEDQEGVDNFDAILEAVDGIMVARGDLGVELPAEEVPILQKQFIYKCRMKGKPVIVATQMLESMRENIRPTRAEVSDVANAVMDGADAVMLSAETSTGKHPIEAVQVMARIAKASEDVMHPQLVNGLTAASLSTDILCKHIFSIVEELDLAGIIVLSKTGKTIGSLARHRPNVPIWNISNNPKQIRQSQLYRGVTGFYIRDFKRDRDSIIRQAIDTVYGAGYLEITDKVAIITGSTILGKNANTILEIVTVKEVI